MQLYATFSISLQPYSTIPIFGIVEYATSLRRKTGDIITFAQFEEGNIRTKTFNDEESGDESNDNSIMPPLIIEEEMEAMDSGDESDHDLISTEILEDIRDGSQYHPDVNQREACYKICDRIKQR